MAQKKQKFFELVPSGTNVQFIKNRWRYISISIIAVLIAFGAMGWRYAATGSFLNFGIDFAGGSQVRLALDESKDPGIDTIRDTLVELGYEGSSVVSVPDAEHEVLVRVKDTLSIDDEQIAACEEAAKTAPAANEGGTAKLVGFNHPEGGSKLFLKYDVEPDYGEVEKIVNEAGCEGTADAGFGGKVGEVPVEFALIGVGAKLREQFDERFGAGTVTDIVRSETVGAKVGGQLKEDGAKSMLFAIAFIFLFVMIRFDLRFAPGGIVALMHDALLVIGAFALTGKEFNLQTIAAVLTIIGYSINDTIVVFDRVRERVALHRDDPIEQTTNNALNDTLSRTILTSGTTLLVVLATYFLGSGPIKDFAFALIIGIVVGTYSSLYIATPVFLWVNRRFYAGRGHLRWIEQKERDGTGTLLGGKSAPAGDGAGGEVVDAVDAVDEVDAVVADEGARKKTRRRRRRPRPAKDDE
jgi:preprotein translocase subunit SecF